METSFDNPKESLTHGSVERNRTVGPWLVSTLILIVLQFGITSESYPVQTGRKIVVVPPDVATGGNEEVVRMVRHGFHLNGLFGNDLRIGNILGRFVVDPADSKIGLEYPAGSGIEHVCGAGPLIGGLIDGAPHLSMGNDGNTRLSVFTPDPRRPGRWRFWRSSRGDSLTEPNGLGCDDDGDWEITTDDIGVDGIPDTDEIGCKGRYDAQTNAIPTENARRAFLLRGRMKTPGSRLPRAAPPSPKLAATQIENGVRLNRGPSSGGHNPMQFWDQSNRFAETYTPDHWRRTDPPCETMGLVPGCGSRPSCDSSGGLPGGRTFEGFRLYRSEHQGTNPDPASFTMIKEFALLDSVGPDLGLDRAFVDTNLMIECRYWYAVTSYAISDMNIITRPSPSGGTIDDTLFTQGLESNISENMERVDQDYTYEVGGWEGRSYEWTDFNRKIRFTHLPRKCTIRIFMVAGEVVTTLRYESPPDDPDEGQLDWRLV